MEPVKAAQQGVKSLKVPKTAVFIHPRSTMCCFTCTFCQPAAACWPIRLMCNYWVWSCENGDKVKLSEADWKKECGPGCRCTVRLKCTCSWTRVEKLSSCYKYKSALEGIKLLLLLLILLRFLNWGKTLFLLCKGMHGHNFGRTLCQQSELTTRCHLHFTLVLNADLRAVDAILGYHVLRRTDLTHCAGR